MHNVTDWQMKRIESPTENPCCALMREQGEYVATVYYVPDSQTWSVDVMRRGTLLYRRDGHMLMMAIGLACEALNNVR